MLGATTLKQCRQQGLVQDEDNLCGYTAISEDGDKIGKVHDFVMDDQCNIRYLVVDTGFWIFGKKILVPVGHIDVRDNRQEIILRGLTREQVQALPPYEEGMTIDEAYETNMMNTYYPEETFRSAPETGQLRYENYDAYKAPKRLRLIEEHLQTATHKAKMGDVRIRKEVDTRMETVEVPVTEERVVVERTPVTEGRDIGEGRIGEGESEITIPLYKDEVEVTKQPVVAEEVTIRKETEKKQRQVQAEVRKERLAMDQEGLPVDERTMEGKSDLPRRNRDK